MEVRRFNYEPPKPTTVLAKKRTALIEQVQTGNSSRSNRRFANRTGGLSNRQFEPAIRTGGLGALWVFPGSGAFHVFLPGNRFKEVLRTGEPDRCQFQFNVSRFTEPRTGPPNRMGEKTGNSGCFLTEKVRRFNYEPPDSHDRYDKGLCPHRCRHRWGV